jgi:hypothetical protein
MSDTVATENPVIDDGSPSGGSQRRLLVVVGGAALLIVIGLGAYFLFLSGGEEEDLGPVPSAAGAQPVEEGDVAKKDKKAKKDTVPGNLNVKFTVGRDPFAPLAVEAVAEPAEVPEDTSDTTKSTDTKSGGGSSTPAPTASPAPAPAPTQDAATSYEVTLLSVDLKKENAVIEVDGKRYLLSVKDMFPNTKTGPFKLTAVGENGAGKATATVVFGSDAPVELIAKDTVVFKP